MKNKTWPWQLYVYFVLGSLIGGIIGGILIKLLIQNIGQKEGVVAGVLVVQVAVGIMQSFILRSYLHNVSFLVIAGFLSGSLSATLIGGLNSDPTHIVGAIVIGACSGYTQWVFVLRNALRRSGLWWVLMSIVGTSAGWLVGSFGLRLASGTQIFVPTYWITFWALFWLSYAIVLGPILLWLLPQDSSPKTS